MASETDEKTKPLLSDVENLETNVVEIENDNETRKAEDVSIDGVVDEVAMLSPTDDNSGQHDQQEVIVRIYPRRWLVLITFALSSATSAILWITFAPIASLSESYYDINSTQVNALSVVFMAAYLPMTIVSSYLFHIYGVREGLILACTLNFTSALIRFLSTESNSNPRSSGYMILLVGQTLGAIAQPFFTNIPARIGSLWFPPNERDLAVVIGSTSNVVGIAVGSILPALFTVDDDKLVRMFDLLLTECIWTALVLGLVFMYFEERPPHPPSISESNRQEQDGQKNVIQELKELFANRSFVVLVICFGVLGLGLFNCLTTVMEQLIEPAGYSADDASLFSGLLVGCGIISAVGVGFALDITHMYNPFLKCGFVLAGCLFIAMLFVLRPDNKTLLAVVFGGMGATMLPLLPLSFECAIECSYPISEDLSSGVLMSAGQVSGIIYILIINSLLEKQPVYETYVFQPVYVVFFISCLLFMTGSYFYNGKYLRLEAERENAQEQEDVLEQEGTRRLHSYSTIQ